MATVNFIEFTASLLFIYCFLFVFFSFNLLYLLICIYSSFSNLFFYFYYSFTVFYLLYSICLLYSNSLLIISLYFHFLQFTKMNKFIQNCWMHSIQIMDAFKQHIICQFLEPAAQKPLDIKLFRYDFASFQWANKSLLYSKDLQFS